VALAEKAGKHVHLMVVPSSHPVQAIVQAAALLYSAEVMVGASPVAASRQQALRFGHAWDALARKPAHQVRLRTLEADGRVAEFVLGAHPPTLTRHDIDLIHDLWMGFKDRLPWADVRHRDVVALALRRLEKEMRGGTGARAIQEMDELKSAERPEDGSRNEPGR
jgi:hypothetical protein